MISILFLILDQIPNSEYWNEWRNNDERIRFYVNAKQLSTETPKGFIRLPQHIEVRDTAWAAHTCVLAHQAMIQFALADFPKCKWFVLVSGDSLPLKSTKTLFDTLKDNTSIFDSFTCKESAEQWKIMNEAALVCHEPNWWVDEATITAEDEEGSYTVIPQYLCQAAHANHILCATHAAALAKMPINVGKDFDRLLALSDFTRYSLGADELIPLNYLKWLQEREGLRGNIIEGPVMYCKLDRKDPKHAAKLTKIPFNTSHLFGRKFYRKIIMS